MNKNEQCIIKIEDMSLNGEGIGKFEGYTLFVKDAIVGDLAKVKVTKAKKTYGYARLEQILEPSPWRVEPVCPQHRRCGGCQLQAMSYEKQLEWKWQKVKNNLERIGGLKNVPMKEIIGMETPFRYRNKAQYPVGWKKDGKNQSAGRGEGPDGYATSDRPVPGGQIAAGFYAGRTHVIIDSEDCFLGQPVNGEILRRVKAYMAEHQVPPYEEQTGTGLVCHVLIREGYHTGEIMVCLVVNGSRLPKEEDLVASLRKIPGMTGILLNENRERTNVILGTKLRILWGKGYITDRIGDITFSISPLSFFQVNPVQTEKLYEKALEYALGEAGLKEAEEQSAHGIKKAEEQSAHGIKEEAPEWNRSSGDRPVIWDLYCGIGTISLFLARKAKKVYGVEIVPEAIADARRNAAANGITNVEFFVGKAEEVVPEKFAAEGIRADVVVVDPPRKGCDPALLNTIVKMSPRRIVYVSCDPATLARDVKILTEKGYEVKEVTPVDMFPMTGHVETVCQLVLRKPVVHINIDVDVDELVQDKRGLATYEQIKAYVLEHSGFKVSHLYIAQVKRKCGIIERENYNKPKSEDARQPQCPPEKEAAIRAALEHFGMI